MNRIAREVDLGIRIPAGYIPLPLSGIDQSIATAAALLREVGPADIARAADQVLPAMEAFLGELARDGVRYCGLGRHSFEDELVTSVLTVLVYDADGDTENPRLVVKNLAEAKMASGEPGEIRVIELDNRPMMFFEQVRELPVPDFPGNPMRGTTAPTYQLEAVIPSEDGSAIAAIELSTIFVGHGPWFRPVVVDMARSVDLQIRNLDGGWLAL